MTINDSYVLQVVALHLKGETRDSITSLTGISAGSVSSILGGLERELGSELLFSLKKFCRVFKQGISPEAALKGYEIAATMQGMGIDGQNIVKPIMTIADLLKKGDAPSIKETLVAISPVLERNPDIGLKDLPRQVEKLVQENKQKTEENALLREKIRDSNEELSRTLESNQATMQDLGQFSNTRAFLTSRGLDINNDLPKFASMLKEANAAGYSADSIIKKCDYNDSLDTRNDMLEREISVKETMKKELETSFQQLELQKRKHQSELEMLHKVKRIGFGVNELTIIWQAMEPLMSKYSLDQKTVLQKMLSDLKDNYCAHIFFEEMLHQTKQAHKEAMSHMIKLLNEIADLGGKKDDLENQFVSLDQKYQQEQSMLQKKIQEAKEAITNTGSCWKSLIQAAIDRQIPNPVGPLHKEMPYWLVEYVARYWFDSEERLTEFTPLILVKLECEVPNRDLLRAYLYESEMVMRLIPGTFEAQAIEHFVKQLKQSPLVLEGKGEAAS